VCVQCTVEKQLTGSRLPDAVWDGEWVGRGMGVLDGGSNRRRGRGSFVGEFWASHCNQWGLCCIVVRERRALPKLPVVCKFLQLILFRCREYNSVCR